MTTTEDREKLLSALDDLRRRVVTGEIESLVAVAGCTDGGALSRVVGEMLPPHGILVLQDIASELRRYFLNDHNEPDDGAPRLGVARDEADTDSKEHSE